MNNGSNFFDARSHSLSQRHERISASNSLRRQETSRQISSRFAKESLLIASDADRQTLLNHIERTIREMNSIQWANMLRISTRTPTLSTHRPEIDRRCCSSDISHRAANFCQQNDFHCQFVERPLEWSKIGNDFLFSFCPSRHPNFVGTMFDQAWKRSIRE